MCDTLKCWDFVTKAPEGLEHSYLVEPRIVTVVDSRAGTGALLHKIATEQEMQVELNWFMPLSNEKTRMLCQAKAIQPNDSEEGDLKVLAVWKEHPDDM